MKIKTTLYSILAVVLALFLLGGFAVFFLMSNLKQEVTALKTEVQALQLEGKITDISDKLTSTARAYVNTGESKYYDQYMNIVNGEESYTTIIAELDALLPTNIVDIAREIQTTSNELGQIEDDSFKMLEAGQAEEAQTLIYSDRYYASKAIVDERTATFSDTLISWTDEAVVAAEKKVSFSLVLLVVSLVLFFLFTLGAVLFVIRKLKPLYTVTNYASELADGNLTLEAISVPDRAKDEIADLSRSFNKMYQNLQSIISTVYASSSELSASSEELVANARQSADATEKVTKSVEEVSVGANTQLEQISESTRAISEVATGISHIASTASDVANSSETASSKAQQGGEQIENAVQQMKEIEQVVNETMASIAQLDIRSKEIENIVDAITQIADQTNLLALNAAIEAARAGDAGKGFAVVADEVRKLAEQSNTSAQQIADLIHSIQSDTQQTVQKMTKVNENVISGVETIATTGAAFTEIISSSKEVTHQIQEVSAVSEQMAASAQQVSATFETINSITQQSVDTTSQVASLSQEQLASTEEISSASALLNDLALKLNEQVSRFRLE